METNKELQSRGFGLQRRLASTDTYDITKILSRGGKRKSFDTLIFSELQKMKMFVFFFTEKGQMEKSDHVF